jgi:hypothetical protein
MRKENQPKTPVILNALNFRSVTFQGAQEWDSVLEIGGVVRKDSLIPH